MSHANSSTSVITTELSNWSRLKSAIAAVVLVCYYCLFAKKCQEISTHHQHLNYLELFKDGYSIALCHLQIDCNLCIGCVGCQHPISLHSYCLWLLFPTLAQTFWTHTKHLPSHFDFALKSAVHSNFASSNYYSNLGTIYCWRIAWADSANHSYLLVA